MSTASDSSNARPQATNGLFIGSLLILAAAGVVAYGAWDALKTSCDEPTVNCNEALWNDQFVVALLGLAPAILAVGAAQRRYLRLALAALLLTVLAYIVWGFVYDAAVHNGWGPDRVLP
jgi:hypothetical protein